MQVLYHKRYFVHCFTGLTHQFWCLVFRSPSILGCLTLLFPHCCSYRFLIAATKNPGVGLSMASSHSHTDPPLSRTKQL